MITKDLEVLPRAGIHARPASIIAETANKFSSSIEIEKENMRINAKSIMGIITLGATYKTKLKLICNGNDEEEAAKEMEKLFLNRFEVEKSN